MKEIIIYVATHKFFVSPACIRNTIYKPIVAGADFHKAPYLKDNIGDTISSKNSFYCELTALYWIWKYDSSRFTGLMHYHRYFYDNHFIRKEEIKDILQNFRIIVPEPIYFPCSVLEQYGSVHYKNDLLLACNEIIFHDASYKSYVEKVLYGNKLYVGNMFITSKQLLDSYCSFLFPLLFELEKQIPYLTYSSYNQRVFGFLAERIFNIYLLRHNISLYEYPVLDTYSSKKQTLKRNKILEIIKEEKEKK